MKTPDPKKFKFVDYNSFKTYIDEKLAKTSDSLKSEAMELEQLRDFIADYQLVTNNNTD